MKKGKKKTNRVVFLSGKKVDLVIIEKNDISKVIHWINDQDVTKFLMTSIPMYRKIEEEWLERMGSHENDIVLGIATKKGKLIGSTGLHGIKWKDRRATHGICIGDKNYWSGGYGTDAGMILFKYGFESLGFNKINSSLIGFNERSLRYHLGCGFKIAGKRKKQVFVKGEFFDEIFVDLFPKDFKKAWKKYKSSK